MNSKNNLNKNYRPEIDGIRALAVFIVIINHFNKELLPSGYLGVDIFFVISGYVITKSFFTRKSKSFKDFIIEFYERRVKRLLPALSVFVLIGTILICMFSQSPGQSLKTGIFSLFGLSNLYLFNISTNYFASYTDLNLFTHTWSLGVEEQFYFIYPFLIWFSGYGIKSRTSYRNLSILITIFAVPSLIGFVYFYSNFNSASYFLMPLRFWEIASGCLLFIGSQRRLLFLKILSKFPPMLLLVLLFGIILLQQDSSGFSTILIVLIALMLINCLKKGSLAYNYFTNRYVIYIGKLSYSLYLWHWGILAISRWTIGIYWWTVPIQCFLIFVISFFSYKFIETPLREANWFREKWINIIFNGGLLASLAGFIYLNGKPFKGFLYAGNSPVSTIPRYSACHLPDLKEKIENHKKLPLTCGSFDLENVPTIYGIGDSHIEQFGYGISTIAKAKNYNYAVVWQSSCFFPATITFNPNNDCLKNQTAFQKKLIKNIIPGDIIIVGNYLFDIINLDKNEFRKITYNSRDKQISRGEAAEVFSQNFIKFSEEAIKKGAKVILYIDGLIYPSLNMPGATCTEEWFRKSYNIPDNCKKSITPHIKIFNKYFKWRHAWKDNKTKFVLNAYLYAEDCKNDICYASKYNDGNHFTSNYAKRILNNFIQDNPLIFSTHKRVSKLKK